MAKTPRTAWAGSGPPTHLVLFAKPSEQNEALLSEIVGDKSPAREGAKGLMRFKPGRGRKSSALLHERKTLALAEVDMTENEAESMRSAPNVEMVVRNELRTIPRPIPSRPDAASLDGGHQGGGGVSLPSSTADYLRGIRDLAEMLLEGGSAQFRPPVQRQMAGAEVNLTWGLSAIGIAPGSPYSGRGVKVAVLDTGLDLTHPDFAGIDPNNCESFIPGVNSVQDGNGHGTHCCGTVAGPARPAQGPRYGVAPGVELLVGKVLSDEGSGWDNQIVDGMIWAADEGAKVISMSLGGGRRDGDPFSRFYEQVAARLTDEGVLTICAAGNESHRPFDIAAIGNPAACPSTMSVAALDVAERVASFSCGVTDNVATLDIAAPGVDVHSAWIGGGYSRINGTSMATPHVAGAAALYLEQDPSLSADELRQLLRDRARPLRPQRDFGAGLLQAP